MKFNGMTKMAQQSHQTVGKAFVRRLCLSAYGVGSGYVLTCLWQVARIRLRGCGYVLTCLWQVARIRLRGCAVCSWQRPLARIRAAFLTVWRLRAPGIAPAGQTEF